MRAIGSKRQTTWRHIAVLCIRRRGHTKPHRGMLDAEPGLIDWKVD